MAVRGAGTGKGAGRIAPLAGVVLFLSGCALPLPIQIASWVLDGGSMLATGKTLTDHALSTVVDRDCALWRAASDDPVCREEAPATTLAAAAPRPGNAGVDDAVQDLSRFETAAGGTVSRPRPLAPPPKVATALMKGAPVVSPLAVTAASAWAPTTTTATTADEVAYIIGSFAVRTNAETLATRHAGLGAMVIPARLDGDRNLYRVAIGPFDRARLAEMRQVLAGAGIDDAWTMRLKPNEVPRAMRGLVVRAERGRTRS